MGPKGGGRKGFVKAAAATKVAEPPPVPDSLDHVGQVYRDPAQEANGKDGRARPAPAAPSVLSLPEPTPADGESRGQMLQRHKKVTGLQLHVTHSLRSQHALSTSPDARTPCRRPSS